jgi:DNA primase
MIAPEVIDYIKANVNIVEIVSNYVELTKKKYRFSGKCPICKNETNSLEVSQERQYFHCSKCNCGGNVFTFIQKIEDLSFPNAVKRVSEIAKLNFGSIVKEQDNSLHLVVGGSDEEKAKIIKFLDENKIKYVRNK